MMMVMTMMTMMTLAGKVALTLCLIALYATKMLGSDGIAEHTFYFVNSWKLIKNFTTHRLTLRNLPL